MRTEGAFLVSAERVGGTVTRVEVTSEAGGCFRLANPWQGPATLEMPDRRETVSGKVLEVVMDAGQTIAIVPVEHNRLHSWRIPNVRQAN